MWRWCDTHTMCAPRLVSTTSTWPSSKHNVSNHWVKILNKQFLFRVYITGDFVLYHKRNETSCAVRSLAQWNCSSRWHRRHSAHTMTTANAVVGREVDAYVRRPFYFRTLETTDKNGGRISYEIYSEKQNIFIFRRMTVRRDKKMHKFIVWSYWTIDINSEREKTRTALN